MKAEVTNLSGVTLFSPPQYADDRGIFRRLFAERLHAQSGYAHTWSEMNLSTTKPNSIRGLHFQAPHPQAKLISVIEGTIFDVAVDLRRDSPTFGKWQGFTLSSNTPGVAAQIYLPEGFAHGLATPHGEATIAYLVSSPWNPETERVLAWNDPSLAIPWPIESPILSPRDKQGILLCDLGLFGEPTQEP